MKALGARRWWAVGALVLAVLAVGFDVTILSLALPAAAHAVREGVYGGLEVARRTGSAALAGDIRAAFVHGMDVLLVVSACLGALGALLALFLPARRREEVGPGRSERPESEHEAAV